ncbi:hypothetical protein SeLEV6574_g03909 [Synchytrium endobioticum]|uniref:FCP1 homology domain-containing protein n=1 Tax=Synchytrium endobioticum TaxID=286115 RepID=A0A507D1N2_9FUNG|nr:hypothetical protein SeLEV6574_g03909 [Synchytrium endobioticum]
MPSKTARQKGPRSRLSTASQSSSALAPMARAVRRSARLKHHINDSNAPPPAYSLASNGPLSNLPNSSHDEDTDSSSASDTSSTLARSKANGHSIASSMRGSAPSLSRIRRPIGSPSRLSNGPSSRDHRKIKTLVLDLDETLIHSTSRGSRNHDHMIEVLVDKYVCLYYVYKRPHVDLFLQTVSQWYHLVIFTASMPEYADPVIEHLDRSRTLFSRRFFRAACTNANGVYMKNLSVIEPDLSQVCLLDNSPMSYADHPDNAIPIESWISDPHDEALLDLLPFLDALRFTEDVRTVLSMRV